MEPWDRTPKWLRWTQHPNVLSLLGIGLLMAIILLPVTALGYSTRCHRGLSLYAYITDEGLVVCGDDVCDESHTELESHQSPAAWISVRRVHETSGYFFDTISRHGTRIRVLENYGQTIDGDLESAVVDAALDSWYAPNLAGYRPGEPVRVGVVWSGVILNILCLCWISAFLYGFVTRKQRTIRLERLKQGRCPICRYSIEGLPTHRCPECGSDTRDPALRPSE